MPAAIFPCLRATAAPRAPAGGFEPPTKRLTIFCTAVVLRRRGRAECAWTAFYRSGQSVPIVAEIEQIDRNSARSAYSRTP